MLRTARNFGPRSAGFSSKLPSRTIQSGKNDADINVIVKRFGVTRLAPVVERIPLRGDYDAVFDFQTAMGAVRKAQEAFNALPSNVRTRFQNNPQVFEAFCTATDEEGNLVNLAELRKLGLAKPAKEPVKEPAPIKVEVVTKEVPVVK